MDSLFYFAGGNHYNNYFKSEGFFGYLLTKYLEQYLYFNITD